MGVHARLNATGQSPCRPHHRLGCATHRRFVRTLDQKLKAMSAPQSGQRRRGRAEPFDAGGVNVCERFCEFIRSGSGGGFVGPLYERVNQMSERRISDGSAVTELLEVEALEIVIDHGSDRIVRGDETLHDHASGRCVASGAARDLGQ